MKSFTVQTSEHGRRKLSCLHGDEC